MFSSLGRLAVRRRRVVLALTGLFFVVSVVVGTGVFDALSSGGFEDPEAESTAASELLEDRFDQGEPNLVLLLRPEDGDVDTAVNAAAGQALTDRLGDEPLVDQALSYWSLGSPPPLRAEDGGSALLLGVIDGDEDEVEEAAGELAEEYRGTAGGLTVEVGGQEEVFRQVGTTIESDLARAEAIAVPITLVLLVFTFGGLVAASLPLFVGAIAVFGTFLSLLAIAAVTDVSIFSINLTTAMGLGLAIDYSLFVVSRFREELRQGLGVDEAVVRTVETAGRTVAFSALTVAVSLSALLVFPLYFLRSFAYAGIAVVVVAALASVLSLASLLAVLGERVNRLQLWKRPPPEEGTGFWHRVAVAVMRRPVPVATVVIVALLFLGSPFLGVEFGQPDDRVLPEGNPARAVSDELRAEYASNETNAFGVVSVDRVAVGDEVIDGYAAELSQLDDVERVDARTGGYVDGDLVLPPGAATERFEGDRGTWLSVVPAVEPISAEGEALVADVRDLDGPFDVLVGGNAAGLVDSKSSILDRLPLAGGIVAVATFVLLFLLFGSLLVPLKAIVVNLLSLTATFGAMVWVFQDGNGSGVLDFTATGALDTTTPILMFCIAFGLSMDYEVFLLSRIKEEHDRTGDNTRSVAMGLERTGRIVTAAAALLAVTFLAFSTSQVSFIKLFGVGLALAVIMDATVVRATLVPAFMRLAGEANWWAPRPLRRLHDRIGIAEAPPPSPSPPPAEAAREPEPVG
ncbi:MAG: MMPL family transporter [Acidimicrobiia bacterium]|nr:MMPL family transporter [Acidimicrobiia bacterium]